MQARVLSILPFIQRDILLVSFHEDSLLLCPSGKKRWCSTGPEAKAAIDLWNGLPAEHISSSSTMFLATKGWKFIGPIKASRLILPRRPTSVVWLNSLYLRRTTRWH